MSLSDAPSEDAPDDSLTTDQVFDLLGDGQRRRAIAALRARDGEADLDELAEATAAREEDIEREEVDEGQRERTAAMLHHAHLPRLEDANVAEYDPMAGEVELTEVAGDLDPYFEVIETCTSE
jgi:DNA-binding transcriptional ArsR family regulator